MAVLLGTAVAVPAQEAERRERAPADYSGHLQLHQVPVGPDQRVPRPQDEPNAPVMPGGRGNAPVKAEPIPTTLTVRPPLDYRTREEKEKDAKRSGWGWLADDVFSARERQAELDEEGEVRRGEGREADADAERERANGPDEYGLPESAGAGGATNSDEAVRQSRGADAGGWEEQKRARMEPAVEWNNSDERWRATSSEWSAREAPDMGISVTGDVSSWEVTRSPGTPRDEAPIDAAMAAAEANVRAEAMRDATRPREVYAMPEAGSPGSFRSPVMSERSSLFNPLPASSDSSVGTPAGWGVADLGAPIAPVSLQPVQASLSLPAPSTAPLSSTPSAASTAPSLGGMGTEGDRVLPKTLPW